MLQARLAVVRYPSLSFSLDQICEIINASVMMHSMIIRSERDVSRMFNEPFDYHDPLAESQPGVHSDFAEFLAIYQKILDETTHIQMQNDLITHLWAIRATKKLDYHVLC